MINLLLIITTFIGAGLVLGLGVLKFYEQYAFLHDIKCFKDVQGKSEAWFGNNLVFLDLSFKTKLWIFFPIPFLKPVEISRFDNDKKYYGRFNRLSLLILSSILLCVCSVFLLVHLDYYEVVG